MDVILDKIGDSMSDIHVIIFIIGASGNLALLIAAIFSTPQTIKTYAIMIRCGTVSDLVCVCCDFFTITRLLIVPGNILYLFSGPCSHISTRSCYIVHCIQIVTLVYSGYVMLASFAFRLWILHLPSPSDTRIRIAMFLILLPPAIVGFAFTYADADIEFLQEYLLEHAPKYLSEPGALSGHPGMTPHMIFTIIYVVTAPGPIYGGLIILVKLLEFADSMSLQSRNMHKNFVKALTIHASLCLITIFGVLIYFALFFEVYYHPTMEKLVYTFAAFPPALTPYGFLYYVRPYRMFILSFFRRVPLVKSLTAPVIVVNVCQGDLTTVSS